MGNVIQIVEYLPNRHRTLVLIPNTTLKKKKPNRVVHGCNPRTQVVVGG